MAVTVRLGGTYQLAPTGELVTVVWTGCQRISLRRTLERGRWLGPNERTAFWEALRAGTAGLESSAWGILALGENGYVTPNPVDLYGRTTG